MLSRLAEKAPAIVNPPALPYESSEDCDEAQVGVYRDAVAACERVDLSGLAQLVRSGPWQAPPPSADFSAPEHMIFKRAADELAKQKMLECLFDFGTRIRDCQGSAMHQILGTGLRIKARRAGYQSNDYPDERVWREGAKAEIDRFVIPHLLTGDMSIEHKPDGTLPKRCFALEMAKKIAFGGMEYAMDRQESWTRVLLARNRAEQKLDQRQLLIWAREEAPFVPVSLLWPLPPPMDALVWALRMRRRRGRIQNPLGKIAVAHVYAALFLIAQAHDNERIVGDPRVIRS